MKCLTVISASFILFYLIGFSVGDELGFGESLGNVEGNKRRSLNVRTGSNIIGVGASPKLQPGQIQQSRPIALTAAKPKTPIRMNTSPKMGMTQAISLPLGVPAFKPLRPDGTKEPMVQTFDAAKNSFRRNDVEIKKSNGFQINMNEPVKIYPVNHQMQPINQGANPMTQARIVTPSNSNTMTIEMKPNPIPPFQAMPQSISRITPEGTLINDQKRTTQGFQPDPMPIPPSTKLPVIDLMGHTVEELAAAANVSVAVIQAAIKMRQQELLAQQQMEAYQKLMATETKPVIRTTSTSTTTTTQKPKSQYKIAGGNKVMNAPKEYYPVGYEKNFDDNFTSKVELPKTSFHCGDQKHFPGLYADEDLGCMVFHVCALTDDGLIMKSFLCPESTLFDQTVLKCNWWFYVDCKSSKNLYDSNIPVSKSYQLMKALTFFSNYKTGGNDEDGVDIETLKNSVNQNSKPT